MTVTCLETGVGVGHCMLTVTHLAPKILIAVSYCGHPISSSRIAFVAPVYHKEEGATHHLSGIGLGHGMWVV